MMEASKEDAACRKTLTNREIAVSVGKYVMHECGERAIPVVILMQIDDEKIFIAGGGGVHEGNTQAFMEQFAQMMARFQLRPAP